jgi:hypothetical protein
MSSHRAPQAGNGAAPWSLFFVKKQLGSPAFLVMRTHAL